MATEIGTETNRLTYSLLGEQLVEDVCSFEFFQAVTLLQRLQEDSQHVGGFSSPEDEAVHFRVNQRLGFPASEIQSLQVEEGSPPEMTVNFMGISGPMSLLPYAYCELILDRARAKDHAMSAFLDIFNHRAISLFYRGWQRSKFHVTYQAGERDKFTHYLLDLVGLGTAGLRDRQDVEDEAFLHYVSLMASQLRSAVALEQVIADYFEVAVDIEQFTGGWYGLDKETQCAMKEEESPSLQMGAGAVVGDAVWDRQSRVRIRLGPMGIERYHDFLPGGSAHKSLTAVTRFFSNQCLEFEVQLVLDRNEVPKVELDLDSKSPARLGWLSWAKTEPTTSDKDDTILTL